MVKWSRPPPSIGSRPGFTSRVGWYFSISAPRGWSCKQSKAQRRASSAEHIEGTQGKLQNAFQPTSRFPSHSLSGVRFAEGSRSSAGLCQRPCHILQPGSDCSEGWAMSIIIIRIFPHDASSCAVARASRRLQCLDLHKSLWLLHVWV